MSVASTTGRQTSVRSVGHRRRGRRRTTPPHSGSRWATAAWLAIGFLVLGACSGADDNGGDDASAVPDRDPATALQAAVDALGEWSALTTTIGLDLDDTARAELVAEGELSEADVDVLTDATLRITTGPAGEGVSDVSMTATVGGTPAFEYRSVDGGRVFIRIDLDTAASLEQGNELNAAVAEVTEMGTMLGFADAAQALTSGGWVELVGVESAMEAIDEPDTDTLGQTEPEPVDERVLARVEAFLDDDVDVSWVEDDGSDGDRVHIETDGAALEVFLEDISDLVGDQDVIGGTAEDLVDGIEIAENEVVTADAWIVDGALSKLAIDLSVLDEVEITGEAVLVFGFEESPGDIEVPTDAITVDVEEVVVGFFGGMFGGFDGEGGFGEDVFGELPDGFPEDDGTDDPAEGSDGPDAGDEPASDPGDGPGGGGAGGTPGECISAQELEDLAEFAGPEAVEALRSLIDQGLMELC